MKNFASALSCALLFIANPCFMSAMKKIEKKRKMKPIKVTFKINKTLRNKIKTMLDNEQDFYTFERYEKLLTIREEILLRVVSNQDKNVKKYEDVLTFVNELFNKKCSIWASTASDQRQPLYKFVINFETALEKSEKDQKQIALYLEFKKKLTEPSFQKQLAKAVCPEDRKIFAHYTLAPFISIFVKHEIDNIAVVDVPSNISAEERKYILENYNQLLEKIKNNTPLDKNDTKEINDLMETCKIDKDDLDEFIGALKKLKL